MFNSLLFTARIFGIISPALPIVILDPLVICFSYNHFALFPVTRVLTVLHSTTGSYIMVGMTLPSLLTFHSIFVTVASAVWIGGFHAILQLFVWPLLPMINLFSSSLTLIMIPSNGYIRFHSLYKFKRISLIVSRSPS